MSMTKEEAIERFEKQLTAAQVVLDSGFGTNLGESDLLYRRRKEMAEIALSALRPVSREQVEKVWRGKWLILEYEFLTCSRCGESCYSGANSTKDAKSRLDDGLVYNFCPHCGRPMTDKAVQMVMERLEALNEV